MFEESYFSDSVSTSVTVFVLFFNSRIWMGGLSKCGSEKKKNNNATTGILKQSTVQSCKNKLSRKVINGTKLGRLENRKLFSL